MSAATKRANTERPDLAEVMDLIDRYGILRLMGLIEHALWRIARREANSRMTKPEYALDWHNRIQRIMFG
jgi:hypothetical protein